LRPCCAESQADRNRASYKRFGLNAQHGRRSLRRRRYASMYSFSPPSRVHSDASFIIPAPEARPLVPRHRFRPLPHHPVPHQHPQRTYVEPSLPETTPSGPTCEAEPSCDTWTNPSSAIRERVDRGRPTLRKLVAHYLDPRRAWRRRLTNSAHRSSPTAWRWTRVGRGAGILAKHCGDVGHLDWHADSAPDTRHWRRCLNDRTVAVTLGKKAVYAVRRVMCGCPPDPCTRQRVRSACPLPSQRGPRYEACRVLMRMAVQGMDNTPCGEVAPARRVHTVLRRRTS